MDKTILVLCASPRRGGNSEALADEFIRGADAVGTIQGNPAMTDAYEMGGAV